MVFPTPVPYTGINAAWLSVFILPAVLLLSLYHIFLFLTILFGEIIKIVIINKIIDKIG